MVVILKNRFDIVAPPWMVRYRRNLVGQCRMTCQWKKLGQNQNRK